MGVRRNDGDQTGLALAILAALEPRLPMLDVETITPGLVAALRADPDRDDAARARQADVVTRVRACPFARPFLGAFEIGGGDEERKQVFGRPSFGGTPALRLIAIADAAPEATSPPIPPPARDRIPPPGNRRRAAFRRSFTVDGRRVGR